MFTATLTSKGQTTIPKEIRQHLKLASGDRIEFITRNDGTALLAPAASQITLLKGLVKTKNKFPVSLESMKAAISDRFSKKS